jgi:predicted glutamine amidotransferase
MCRLFAFHSRITSQVHSSLVSADNTLHDLSFKHPDGWGVAYYVESIPHLVKSTDCAMEDQLFQRVSGVVSSNTVVAHIRKATQGDQTILNSHPFQFGKWIFAHNGNIKDFKQKKPELLELIDHDLKRFILGSTDSELIFFIFLSEMKKKFKLQDNLIPLQELSAMIEIALKKIIKITGSPTHRNDPTPTENYFSFILTNGKKMIGFNGGQDFYYCTYKTSCPEKETCPHYAKNCESPPDETKDINHLIFSSEKMSGPNIWKPIKAGQLIGVDKDMKFFSKNLDILFDL